MKNIFPLFIVIATALLLLPGCKTIENAFDSKATVEKKGLITPSRFFLLKGSNTEYINNINFKKYSGLLTEKIETGAWKQASYGKAHTFLLLEYGIDSFYEKNVTIKPEYDEDSNTTEWVHKGACITSKPYVRITGINAEDYRVEQKETVTFRLLVTYPEKKSLDEGLILTLIGVAAKILL